MNCTVCGKDHTKERPLTIAQNNEWLCPGCLKELDGFSKPTAGYNGTVRVSYSGSVKIGSVELPVERVEIE